MKMKMLAWLLMAAVTGNLLTGCGAAKAVESGLPEEKAEVISEETDFEETAEERAESLEASEIEAEAKAEAVNEQSGEESADEALNGAEDYSVEGTEDAAMDAKQAAVVQEAASAAVASEGENTISAGVRDTDTVWAELGAAIASGNTERQKQLEAELAQLVGTGLPGDRIAEASSDGSKADSAKSAATVSTGFADLVNEGRAAEGLDGLSWSDSLASTALERAEELVSDFSHNGARDCGGEIIGKMSGSDISQWYSSFYDSSSHRTTMMAPHFTKMAAAYCYSGGYYYVVGLFYY